MCHTNYQYIIYRSITLLQLLQRIELLRKNSIQSAVVKYCTLSYNLFE